MDTRVIVKVNKLTLPIPTSCLIGFYKALVIAQRANAINSNINELMLMDQFITLMDNDQIPGLDLYLEESQ